MRKIITIVGGRGAMGQLFHKYWQSHTVRILDKNDWANAYKLLHDADLVIVSVPVHITKKIIIKVTNYISPKTILADFTSIKVEPIKTMLENHSGPILGLHPTFGPSITSSQNQVIINCGGRDNNRSKWVILDLKRMGFVIKKMTATSHDHIMSFIQGIEHFSTICLGTFLHEQKLHPETLFNLASPIYQTKLVLMGRIFDQDPNLYADIIMANEERIELISKYVDYLKTWVDDLRKKNKKKFIQAFAEGSIWMGKFTHDAQLASDQFLTSVSESLTKRQIINQKI